MNPFYYTNNLLLILLVLWTIPWKVYAVWISAKRGHKRWFIALLIINTLSILEIIYIFYIVKKTPAEVRRDFRRAFKIKS
ncbi:DUF5652 family protein [Patescibacteria group bacterium]|nr:DUF5652 family protein [Patescibacteria group bacterium]